MVEGVAIIVKDKKNWTPEKKIEVLKNAKVRNILNNNLDGVIPNK